MAQKHLECNRIIEIASLLGNVIPACRESFLRFIADKLKMTGQGIAQYVFSPHLP
jgi:hypothetical protein